MNERQPARKGSCWRDGLAFGVSITIADPFVAEVIGAAGFDFVLIDTEHAPITADQLQMLLIALRTSASTLFVRPGGYDATLIKQILDLGAEGVGRARGWTTRPPAPPRSRRPVTPRWAGAGSGRAGAARLEGGRTAYIARADDEVAVLVMVESVDALANIDALLQTPGLDGIMVGPPRTWRSPWALAAIRTTPMSAPGSVMCVTACRA